MGEIFDGEILTRKLSTIYFCNFGGIFHKNFHNWLNTILLIMMTFCLVWPNIVVMRVGIIDT